MCIWNHVVVTISSGVHLAFGVVFIVLQIQVVVVDEDVVNDLIETQVYLEQCLDVAIEHWHALISGGCNRCLTFD